MGRQASMAQLHVISLVLIEEGEDFSSLCDAATHRLTQEATNLATKELAIQR